LEDSAGITDNSNSIDWSAVITTYNSCSVIGEALDSILSLDSGESPADIVVVDNNSSDNTAEVLKTYGDRIKLIMNGSNLGLSRANNLGAAEAEGGSLFFLNPDVMLHPGAVTALHAFQQSHPDAALLGPMMVDEEGTPQSTARTWPTPAVIAARRTGFGRTALGRSLSQKHLHRFSGRESLRPHWLVGAALWLTPRGRQRVGLMSEKYFLYFEDVEWCLRTWKRNMEVWYVPSAVIVHVCRRESSSGGDALRRHLRSMLRFHLTHPATAMGLGPGGGNP
jgi:N-acetylglucosaminyl-diphospho-decaprenol L-rhamnosyltransferase